MNPSLIIARKRDGGPLSPEEIAEFITGYVRGDIPDYQMAALAMAIYIRGMDVAETACLTEQMLRSGTTLAWPVASVPIVDKHSTGGIGDKTSLILAPLLACCGVRVPMISGRGLGPTGGTLDKLESIPGFRTDLSIAEIQSIAERVGCVITGATADLVPADRELYALRDVTAAVPSIPLITASIMSKKLAEGLQALVLDVKFGSGAFMKSLDLAQELAVSLVAVGSRMGVNCTALLSDMHQPNGRMVGNAVEVNESIDVLKGSGPADLLVLVLSLGTEALLMSGVARTASEAHEMQQRHIASGRAFEKFREMVAAQGGNLDIPRPVAPAVPFVAARSGYLAAIDAEKLGQAIIELGGGRKVKTDRIDHSVGLEMLVRLGDTVEAGQPLCRVFARTETATRIRPLLESVFTLADEPPLPLPLIAAKVTGHGNRSPVVQMLSPRRNVPLTEAERDALIVAASDAREKAYAPYSQFAVGAALRATNGQIFTGCNVENASFGMTICAERAAVTSAVAAGQRHFEALALVTSGGHSPCGACRQVLAEFCDDLPIFIADSDQPHRVAELRLRDLLPGRFTFPA